MTATPTPVSYLKGLRICLNANYLPGPLAAYLLRCLGAEVIKVEPPGFDLLRNFPPHFRSGNESMGAWFRAINGGFKSIVIDFKKDGSRQVFNALLGQCDVLLDGNRPGRIADFLGTDLADSHPDLIHIPISAYGITGPDRDKAGHDGNLLAFAGNLSYTASGRDGLPAPFSAPVVDILSAHTAALCALAAYIGRSDRKAPRTVDVSMLHTAFFLNQMQVATRNLIDTLPSHDKAWMNGGLANYSVYKTKDGKAVFFGPIEDHLFAKFCTAVSRPDLIPIIYVENDRLKAELERIFISKDLQEWEALLAEVDCCFTPVRNLDEAMQSPQVQHLGLAQEINDPTLGKMKLAGFPAGFGTGSLPPEIPVKAPRPGEHSEWVLREILSMDPSEIAELKATGAVPG